MNKKRILITGSLGFIATSLCNFLLEKEDIEFILGVDKVSPESNPIPINHDPTKFEFVKADINNYELMLHLLENHKINCVIHAAAESHVDRSISDGDVFIESNINGTYNLLKACRKYLQTVEGKGFKFLYLNTDECFGSLKEGQKSWNERSPYKPNNIYSASKASAGLLVRSYVKTFKFPAIVMHLSNNYGKFQHPEKFLSKAINNAFRGKEIPLYGEGKEKREWLYVDDSCEAIYLLINKGGIGQSYNVGGVKEYSNKEALDILNAALKGKFNIDISSLITKVENRLGHDYRYSLCSDKIKRLGWTQKVDFERGIRTLLDWEFEQFKNNR